MSKEMLSVTQDGKQLHVKINYSSLELLQTCLRKAFYYFIRELQSKVMPPALIFGTAFHKAMEVWYCSPFDNRKLMTPECMDAQAAIAYGNDTDPSLQHGGCARCASIFSFVENMSELAALPETEARSIRNGIEILNDYFSKSIPELDPFTIYTDDSGPYIERRIEFVIAEDEKLKITYFGTVDAIWKQMNTKKLYVVDHKTTWQLGKDFTNRHRPNFQYTGYLLGARETFGLDIDSFIVNGVQVAKIKRDSRRIFTYRTKEDYNELRLAVIHNVGRWLNAVEAKSFPMNTPNPCTMYGGCQYHDVCMATAETREPIIRSLYETKPASKND